jgi:hypothetical protein
MELSILASRFGARSDFVIRCQMDLAGVSRVVHLYGTSLSALRYYAVKKATEGIQWDGCSWLRMRAVRKLLAEREQAPI